MIELTITNRKDTSSKMLSIGKQGENKAEQIAVDFALWKDELGSGIITAMMKRHGDTAAYPVVLTVAGNIATWDITSTDTAKDGRGEIEFKYTVSDTVVRSETFPVFVYPSVSAMTTTPPDPYDNWVETLTELGEEVEGYAEEAAESAEEAADAAEEAADAAVSAEIAQLAAEVASTHYPKIDETTKHWLVWNPATSAYTDTGVVAEGSDAEVTAENITAALGYTPADEEDVTAIASSLANKVNTSDYNPDGKTSAMTQAVGKDANGKLWTEPSGGGSEIHLYMHCIDAVKWSGNDKLNVYTTLLTTSATPISSSYWFGRNLYELGYRENKALPVKVYKNTIDNTPIYSFYKIWATSSYSLYINTADDSTSVGSFGQFWDNVIQIFYANCNSKLQ